MLGVVKYKPSLYFLKLCDSCMSARAFSPFQSELFPKTSPNPNECTHERSKSAHTLIHESQRFQNKADVLAINYTRAGYWARGVSFTNYYQYVRTSLTMSYLLFFKVYVTCVSACLRSRSFHVCTCCG